MWHLKCPSHPKPVKSMYLTSFETKSDLQKERSTFRGFVSVYCKDSLSTLPILYYKGGYLMEIHFLSPSPV